MTNLGPAGAPSTTIAAIAGEVGVSVATVSKVLNGRADVAAGTRARVEESLERHQYRRRNRRQPGGSGQIELVFHEFDVGWAMEILRGVEEVTTHAGLGLTVSQLQGAHRPSPGFLGALLARRPLGVLLVLCHLSGVQQQQLRRDGIPFVVVDTDSATSSSVPTVGSNNWNGGLLATRHLLELGHRRIAVVSGPRDVLCSRARTAGFRSAHEEAGIPVDPQLVRYGTFSAGTGLEHGLHLLSLPDRPTAIFAGSDMQAIGVLRAARQRGLRVPEDLSVIGYDNLPLAAWTTPALTTVNQPLRDMAGVAIQMLLVLTRRNELATSRIDLVTELVVRESTAPPYT
ncbi:LacI family DNA-binding transcriptional regulator [Micromonospora endolithica]|uniref:LacI family transcriptional regulator n=1 Tax=Micromonospora endolithica TaxID=230091 RepID=A0A3A9YUH2_9ACTN|nr:LacI family DNA-binding transcriptional regulator [Micromonospora endolithica]RKN39590.1 LacI family transcriptional regulator [Micromonospora endolithica]TWJ22279.1 LacI family transcriptional regulator [Micromonospora endolithica]